MGEAAYGPKLLSSQQLHQDKYRSPGETFEESMQRVASALSASQSEEVRLFDTLLNMRFLPAGRIQAGAGTEKKVTLYNCFVSGDIEDDFIGPRGIMARATEAAQTMRMGGGVGYDFSTLRPRGDRIKSLDSQASGPVSFMEIYDAVCRTVASSGHRRGAQMGVLRCLSGDTLVHTLEGGFKIKDLVGKNPYVYSSDEQGKLRIVQADKVFVSDKNRQLVRVTFDNQQHIDCTPDHRFMLKSGRYIEAQDLQCGDSLKAISFSQQVKRNKGKKPYHFLKAGITGHYKKAVHRLVAEDILGWKLDENLHVHHINENSLDNRPQNLEVLSKEEHASQHIEQFNSVRLMVAERRKGKTRAEVYGKEKADAWEAKRQETVKNHKVVSVQEIGLAEEVFDISLPKFHNFAAQEVFVHNCDHPDILEFVKAKQNNHKLTGFNISVGITDEFMRAVVAGQSFETVFNGKVYGTYDAKTLYDQIMRATWDYAEPGVLFLDRINEYNNLWYCENITATNPCSEQPLPANGACLLGSFNLVKYVKKDEDNVRLCFDYAQYINDIGLVVRCMDNVVDVSPYPLEGQRQEAFNKRRMGLGITGFANASEILGWPYGSKEAKLFLKRVLALLTKACYTASAIKASEEGAFPLFDKEKYLQGKFVQTLDKEVKDLIYKHGLRNSHLVSVAPTGTISLCADNVSSGIEPVFSYGAKRTIQSFDGPREEFVSDFAFREHGVLGRQANDIGVQEHLDTLLIAQRYVDSAVSKTCNVGKDVTFEQFENLYLDAWKGGAKGLSTFRINGKRQGVLEATEVPQDDETTYCTVDEHGQRSCA